MRRELPTPARSTQPTASPSTVSTTTLSPIRETTVSPIVLLGLPSSSFLPSKLELPPIERGDVWRRVRHGPKFKRAALVQAIVCGGLHVLIGWLMYSCWGTCRVPDPGERDACFIFPGRGGGLRHPYGVNLMVEIFVDATITAFMISLLHWPLRFRDVRLGIIPLVEPDAFPRGFVLTLLFPNWIDCLDSQRPTRNDWAAHLRTLVALSIVWGVLWGGFTLCVLLAVSFVPYEGQPFHSFCLRPWTYILVRAVWSDIEVVLVAMGSFVLWSSRAAPSMDENSELFSAVVDYSSPRGWLREPLAPATAPATGSVFVAVN
jgi:hypothetical protein